jgi:arginyl-tRNA--protein-N-Asp/Glu arginylyltransferase
MQILHRFQTGPERCHYLPERSAVTEYELASQLSPEEYEGRMNAGWRKFGALLFRPACQGCRECRPLRIDVARFAPDRSQRRALTRNSDLSVRLAVPSVDGERLRLFQRYHDSQSDRKGWPTTGQDAQDYAAHFVYNPLPAVEISVWDDKTLRAVVLTEVTPSTVSGIYHYHDPDCRDRSLGTFGMLQALELARRLGKPWAYFGFYVSGCGSLAYKARFRPCELLSDRGEWLPLTADA